MHDTGKTGFANVISEALPGDVCAYPGENAEASARDHKEDHADPGADDKMDVRETSVSDPEDSPVDDHFHHAGLEKVHADFEHHEKRSEEDQGPVLCGEFQKF